jgi:hypothetical protein
MKINIPPAVKKKKARTKGGTGRVIARRRAMKPTESNLTEITTRRRTRILSLKNSSPWRRRSTGKKHSISRSRTITNLSTPMSRQVHSKTV